MPWRRWSSRVRRSPAPWRPRATSASWPATFPAAVAEYEAATARGGAPAGTKEMLSLAQASAEAIEGHVERRSAHFVFRFAPEDEVLADYGLETLEAAAAALGADLGFEIPRPIPVDILRGSRELASMTTLSELEIERTGTVAVSKWSRIMLTSPRAMRLGYEWQDSLGHELVHYAVAALTHDRAPVWLQEGLGKFLEQRWRAPAGLDLGPSLQHLLAKALQSGKLIGFEAMHPSMAKLPRAEDAGLAFAEVTTAVACLFARGAAPRPCARCWPRCARGATRATPWRAPTAAAGRGRTSSAPGGNSWRPSTTRRCPGSSP